MDRWPRAEAAVYEWLHIGRFLLPFLVASIRLALYLISDYRPDVIFPAIRA
jgi:hypothetical protein